MNGEAIPHYINDIISLYVGSWRAEFQKPRLFVSIVMGNHGAPRNADVLDLMRNNELS
jgi:hypothetical protein